MAKQNEVTNTYVEYEYPGSFFSESETEKVTERDIKKAARKQGIFAFRFYDLVETEVIVGGEKTRVTSKRRNVSKTYFPGGKVLTVEDVRKMKGDYGILISNMECNRWPKVVQTRRGNFQPFDNKCEIL